MKQSFDNFGWCKYTESIHWVNPEIFNNENNENRKTSPFSKRLRRASIDDVVYLTEEQINKSSNGYIHTTVFVKPSDYLSFTDPFWDWSMEDEETRRKIIGGSFVAPPQVKCTIDEFAKFPIRNDPTKIVIKSLHDKNIRSRKCNDTLKKDDPLYEVFKDMIESTVLENYGLSAAITAMNLYEEKIPVTVWIKI